MFANLLRKTKEENKSVVGRQVELYHDLTVFQYGTVFLDNIRYSVRTNDGSELCKGALVEVLEEHNEHGSTILTVKRV